MPKRIGCGKALVPTVVIGCIDPLYPAVLQKLSKQGARNDWNEMSRMRQGPYEYAGSPGGSLGSAVRVRPRLRHTVKTSSRRGAQNPGRGLGRSARHHTDALVRPGRCVQSQQRSHQTNAELAILDVSHLPGSKPNREITFVVRPAARSGI